jgi:hypothetical protein
MALPSIATERGTSPWVKLLIQTSAAMVLVLFGFGVPTITNPFGEPIASGIWKGVWRPRGDSFPALPRSLKILFGVLFGAFTILYLCHAWAPEMSPDGSGYHLGLLARYLREHGFERLTTNMYAGLSAGIEMLFVPAFVIGRHSAAALVHFAMTFSLALAMFAYGRRLGKPWVGAVGALLMYASPVVGLDGTSAYIDVGVAAIARQPETGGLCALNQAGRLTIRLGNGLRIRLRRG